MATNVTKWFLSTNQKMNEVWKTTLSWDRYSIYNTISLIHFQHKLNKEKWSSGKGEHLKNGVNVKTCLSPFCNENLVENRIGRLNQRMKYQAHDRCTMQKQDDHDRWTYPKTSSRKWQQIERMCQPKKRKTKTLKRKYAKLIKWQERTKVMWQRWSNWYSNSHWSLSTLNWRPNEEVLDPNCN